MIYYNVICSMKDENLSNQFDRWEKHRQRQPVFPADLRCCPIRRCTPFSAIYRGRRTARAPQRNILHGNSVSFFSGTLLSGAIACIASDGVRAVPHLGDSLSGTQLETQPCRAGNAVRLHDKRPSVPCAGFGGDHVKWTRLTSTTSMR